MRRPSNHALDSRSIRNMACILVLAVAGIASTARAQFGPEQVIDSGLGAIANVHGADLDGDGKIDLVVCRESNFAAWPALSWYRNLGGGTFAAAQAFPQQPTSATGVVTIDVGADGDLDVVAAVADIITPFGTYYRADLYVNQGGGTFAPPTTIYPTGGRVTHMEVADLEGDGDLDLFVGRGVTIQATIFQAGLFSTQPIDITQQASGLREFRFPDVDGDGDADLVMASLSLGQVLWFDNPGVAGPFSGPNVIDSSLVGAVSVDVADLDNNGRPDVVAAGVLGSSQAARAYKNLGSGLFGPPQPIASTNDPLRVLCMDVDADGFRDVVALELNGAAWYTNDGLGNFGSRQGITTGTNVSKAMTLADLDGDGTADLVLGSDPAGGGGQIAWFRNVNQGYVSFCSGDGSGTACPCGNSGIAGNGCASSVDPGGANLSAYGAASIANDTFVLVGAHMPNSSALYFQGTTQVLGGSGAVFGDGLRCVGGTIVRLGVELNVAGTSSYPSGANVPVSIRGNNAAGNVRNYQCWYRNAAPFCTASTFNFTNGLQTTWTP